MTNLEKIRSLEEKIARIEDLRRWRPMSELPIDGRWVLGREKCDKDEGDWTGREIPGSVHFYDGGWCNSECRPYQPKPNDEWAYIPGQEPKEEV